MKRSKPPLGLNVLMLCLLVICILGSCVGFSIFPLLTLGANFKETNRPQWDKVVAPILGLSSKKTYNLKMDDPGVKAFTETNNYDPTIVATAFAASEWIFKETGDRVDVPMILTVYETESGKGTNMGNYHFRVVPENGATTVVCPPDFMEIYDQDFCISEMAAAKETLDQIKSANRRMANPIASEYIDEDYLGFTGHRASEMGAFGLLSSTGSIICQKGLKNNPDPEIASCDFWSVKTSIFAAAWWFWSIKYRAEQTDDEKFASLRGWNLDEPYRHRLVSRRNEIQSQLEGVDLSTQVIQTEVPIALVTDIWPYLQGMDNIGMLGQLVTWGYVPKGFLLSFGSSQWLDMPTDPNALPIMQAYNPSGDCDGQVIGGGGCVNARLKFGHWHNGIDFGCGQRNVDILAPAPGYILRMTDQNFISDEDDGVRTYGWGNLAVIDHGNGLYSAYFHLKNPIVDFGEPLVQGQPFAKCGTTGDSTGPHLHFEVWTCEKPPVDYAGFKSCSFHDPSLFLGKPVDPANTLINDPTGGIHR